MAVNFHCAQCWIVKPQNEGQNSALAGSARADECISFPGLDVQIDIAHRVGDASRVAESYVFKIELALGRNQFHRIWLVLNRWDGIKDREDLRGGAERTLHHDMQFTQRFDRFINNEDAGNEPEEAAGAEV